jgi:tetratricopeptide (TPR) repeat protein
VAIDPGYAAAWAGIAEAAVDIRADSDHPEPGMVERGYAAAEKAVALAPDLPQSYSIRAYARWNLHFDAAGRKADLARAAELRPKDRDPPKADPKKMSRAERFQARIPAWKMAVDRDPLDPSAWRTLGRGYMAVGDLAHAREALGRTLELSPGHAEASLYMCMSLAADGLNEEALEFAARLGTGLSMFRHWCTAVAQHGLGRNRESQEALDALIAGAPDQAAYQIGQVYAWRGEADLAFEWLERAFAQRDNGLNMMQDDPLLRGLHGDPRYTAMLKKLGRQLD